MRSLYSLGCLCLKIINGPRRLFLMEEREENELCHLLMGDLRDERQKAGKQIASPKSFSIYWGKKTNKTTNRFVCRFFFLIFFLTVPTEPFVGTLSLGLRMKRFLTKVFN